MNFIWIDWATVIVFLALTSAVAFLTRRLISDYDSFLLAGRSLKLFLGMATMGATELGLVTLMYFSEQGFRSGFSAFIIGVIALFACVRLPSSSACATAAARRSSRRLLPLPPV